MGLAKVTVFDHNFGCTEEFTIGVEEEFQIVDPETFELTNAFESFSQAATSLVKVRLERELIESEVEIFTAICSDIRQLRQEITLNRQILKDLALKNGLRLAAAGAHPFSHWQNQQITNNRYYQRLLRNFQWVLRQNNSFGHHVHIGINDPEKAIRVANAIRSYLPHLLALSTNSPFWQGMETGLKSTRAQILNRSFLRKGIPPIFKSWKDYIDLENLLREAHSIQERGEIWWDVRPHRVYGTIEVRICDVQISVEESVALTALIQVLVAKLCRLYEEGQELVEEPKELIDENKWRALRYGIGGNLIDFQRRKEVKTKDAIKALLEFVAETAQDLGGNKELAFVGKMLSQGTGADRQLKIYYQTGNLMKVMEYLVEGSFDWH